VSDFRNILPRGREGDPLTNIGNILLTERNSSIRFQPRSERPQRATGSRFDAQGDESSHEACDRLKWIRPQVFWELHRIF
jgi:hypothetical protein